MPEDILQTIQALDRNNFLFWCAALTAVSLFSLYTFLRNSGKARLIEDIPTSRIRSAAQGYLELEGFGRLLPGMQIIAPLTGTHCLWWQYSIEKKVTRDKRTHWQLVEKKTSHELFMLEDDTGDCLIDPQGAEVHPSRKRTWYGNSHWPKHGTGAGSMRLFAGYRYREQLIMEDDPLYALGLFRTQRASDGHFDEGSEVSALMREWKEDRETMLKRFDVNQDGEIDAREWEAARRVALKRVREAELERAIAPGLHVLSRPVDGKTFLISTTPQEEMTRRFRWKGRFLLLAFLGGIAGLALLLTSRGLI